jgi:hypothetical protein
MISAIFKTCKRILRDLFNKFENIFSKFRHSIAKRRWKKRSANLKTLLNLLSIFNNFIENRFIHSLLSIGMLLPKVLQWHYQIWKKEMEYLGKDDKVDEWAAFSEIYINLDSIFQKIEGRSLKEKQSYAFFKFFKEHAEKYKNEIVPSRDKEGFLYIDYLFDSFYNTFFASLESIQEKDSIWKIFPHEWKITKNNLGLKDSLILRKTLNMFAPWAQERIWQPKEDIDRTLDNVTMNIFPEVNPILWAPILIFALCPYSENRERNIVEQEFFSRRFGEIY